MGSGEARAGTAPGAYDRVGAAAAGLLLLAELTPAERAAAHERVDAAIAAATATTSFADALAAEGQTTVVWDGRALVERRPDGTRTVIDHI